MSQFRKKWKTIFWTLQTIFNYCDVISLQSYQIKQNKGYYAVQSFKVTDVSTDRKPICDFLLVINSNWHTVSYRFEVITDCCLNFGHWSFRALFGGLGSTYTIHLRLIGKCIVYFLLVLIELFSLTVTAERISSRSTGAVAQSSCDS